MNTAVERVAIEIGRDPLQEWPAELRLLLLTFAAQSRPFDNRRRDARICYTRRAQLRLRTDDAQTQSRQVYTRDVSRRGVGFFCGDLLPVNQGGMLTLRMPDGKERTFACTILRCRRTGSNQWYEAAAYFNRESAELDLSGRASGRGTKANA